jgi:UDP:flavonoid glycosyltransferase YjiC (YdhE family)
MRAVLASTGTTGDILPVVWLAEGLRRRGHFVTLALPPNYAEIAAFAGIPFAPLGPPVDTSDIRQTVARLQRKTLRNQLAEVFAGLAYYLPGTYEALTRLCATADVLVSSAYQPAGRMVYDATRIPFATVHLAPTVGPFPEDTRALLAPLINRARLRCGLERLFDPGGADSASPLLALHAISRIACSAVTRDPSYQVTGFFFEARIWPMPPLLRQFSRTGDKPIVCTFGSMVQENLAAVTNTLTEAAHQLSLRIVIQCPWEPARIPALQSSLGSHALVVGHVPHDMLFRMARLVIHHGGAGTTAAALRAGVPSIVVPHILDQPQWAAILRTLGCAPDSIPRQRLTVSELTSSITHALETPSYQRAARACAEHVASESGVETAVNLIERLVH